VDVPVRPLLPQSRRALEVNDLRNLKRLADHRFGNASRLVQFCMVGASGMVVDLSTYALFQWVFARSALASIPSPVKGITLDLATAGALAIGWHWFGTSHSTDA